MDLVTLIKNCRIGVGEGMVAIEPLGLNVVWTFRFPLHQGWSFQVLQAFMHFASGQATPWDMQLLHAARKNPIDKDAFPALPPLAPAEDVAKIAEDVKVVRRHLEMLPGYGDEFKKAEALFYGKDQ